MLIIGFVLQLFLVFARTKTSESDGDIISCFLVDRAETDPETMKISALNKYHFSLIPSTPITMTSPPIPTR